MVSINNYDIPTFTMLMEFTDNRSHSIYNYQPEPDFENKSQIFYGEPSVSFENRKITDENKNDLILINIIYIRFNKNNENK